jgi:hypothetical protein
MKKLALLALSAIMTLSPLASPLAAPDPATHTPDRAVHRR